MLIYSSLYGQMATVGADGPQPVPDHRHDRHDHCCPQPLCGDDDLCDVACTFIDALPNGPMWDRQKYDARQYIVALCKGENPHLPCPSMAMYAIYLAKVYLVYIQQGIWPSIRDSDPLTSADQAYWLERLGWSAQFDPWCYANVLRCEIPYYQEGPCGKEICNPHFDEEYQNALDYNTVRSLLRWQMGFIDNLAHINWIIEPLGAELVPTDLPDIAQQVIAGNCPDHPKPCFSDPVFELRQKSETIIGAPVEVDCRIENPPVSSEITFECDGETRKVFAPLVNALYIVESILSGSCAKIVVKQWSS